MVLNKFSYSHKKIRALSYVLEQQTGLKRITDFDNEFWDVRYIGQYSYITIDFKHKAYFLMNIRLNKEQITIVEDILNDLSWLYSFIAYDVMLQEQEKEFEELRKGGKHMTLLVYTVNMTTNIKIWSKTKDSCVVQEFKDGGKSKKATTKIRYYNGKPYINCKGRRYYLDGFKEVEI